MSPDTNGPADLGTQCTAIKEIEKSTLTSGVARTPHAIATSALLPKLDGVSPGSTSLELGDAIARMSGMTSLYLALAREFVKALSTLVADLRDQLEAQTPQAAVMLLHTTKGNASTLGATLLAQESDRLQRLYATPIGTARCLDQLHAYSLVVESAYNELCDIISQLNHSTGGQTD